MVHFRLLLAGCHLVDRLLVKREGLFLFLFQAFQNGGVGKHHPVHHVAGIVHLVERLQQQVCILLGGKQVGRLEVQGFPLHGFHLRGDIFLLARKHGGLIQGFERSRRDMAPASVIGNKAVQVRRSRLCGKHDGAIHKRHVVAHARQVLGMRVHRVKDLNHVAGLPGLTRRHIARRVGLLHDGIAVHDNLEIAFLDPVRVANLHIEFAATRNRELGGFALREGRFLLNFHAFILPVQKRSRKQVYIQTRFILRVDKLVVLRGVLHARTHAAPHARIHLGIHAVMARARGRKVHVAAMLRVDCRKDMVKKRPLVKIDVMRIVLHVEQALGQLEHVVGVARFRSFAFLHELLVVIERREMFRNAVAANRDAPLVHDSLPEEIGTLLVVLIAGKFRNAGKTHHLRDLRIRVHVREVVIALRHRVQEPLVRPFLRRIQVLLVFREVIRIGIDFGHAAMFSTEHLLHLGIVQAVRDGYAPVTELEEHRLRLFVARIHVCITQARVKLVDVVPGDPIAVLRTGIAVLHLEPHLLPVRHAADIAHKVRVLGILVLDGLELVQDILQTFLYHDIVVICIVHGQGAQVMAQHVAVEARPVRELGCLRAHSRLFVERRKQAVYIIG